MPGDTRRRRLAGLRNDVAGNRGPAGHGRRAALWAAAFAAGLGGAGLGGAGLGGAASGQPLASPPASQQALAPMADRVAAALDLDRLALVIAAEMTGLADPLSSAADGTGDAQWAQAVRRIATPDRLARGLRAGLDQAIADMGARPPAPLAEAVAFWTGDLGRRALSLQLSARVALVDPGVEAAASAAFAEAMARADPRAAQVTRLIAAADLVDPAVALSLNMGMAMLRGLRDAGGLAVPLSDDDIAAEVAAQEAQLRAQLAGWAEALLYLSCAGLTDAEVEVLIAIAASPGGRELSALADRAALVALTDVARSLGRASARGARQDQP
ncbi:hypothetical protein [Paracoccus luteus]|uniref:hypothetical protein n=1 Tax=Paracoccus luteus TaxID=2508543 RepID=UPI00106F488A|nr:hypothetical protein [Paracoccus luteus]